MRVETERKMRRWREQRWLLDQVIQTRGFDWDQGRSSKILRNCGPGVAGDLNEISRRVQKFTDIPREFSRAAKRREELAQEAEKAGHEVEARDHYYIASVFYANAMWAIYEDGNPKRGAWVNFNIRFYVIALIFIIFEVEIAFIFPVATAYRSWIENGQGLFAFVEILLFVGILFLGLVYAWVKGDLEWVKKVKV